MAKLPYAAGDLYAVPVEDGVFSVGLVARTFGKGGIHSYFFCGTHGDLGLLHGQWKVLGPLAGWRPEAWPVPMFRREELLTGRLLGVVYPDERLDRLPCEHEIPREQFASLPDDGMAGADFVRLRLRRLHGITN